MAKGGAMLRVPDCLVKILRREKLDEIVDAVNNFAENHQVVEIKIQYGTAGIKGVEVYLTYRQNPDSPSLTKKIKMICAGSIDEMEDRMNMFARTVTAVDFIGRPMPVTTSDQARGIERRIGFVVWLDQLQI
jgi:hypothetical protein